MVAEWEDGRNSFERSMVLIALPLVSYVDYFVNVQCELANGEGKCRDKTYKSKNPWDTCDVPVNIHLNGDPCPAAGRIKS